MYFSEGYFPAGFFPRGYFPEGATTGPGPTARNLAEAIEYRALANLPRLSLISSLYESEAGERPASPYAIFTIRNGPAYYQSSTSRWRDAKVRFKVFAGTQEDANLARDQIAGVFGAGDYPYRGGYSIPFFEADEGEGKEPHMGPGGVRVYSAWIEYSARCRKGA